MKLTYVFPLLLLTGCATTYVNQPPPTQSQLAS